MSLTLPVDVQRYFDCFAEIDVDSEYLYIIRSADLLTFNRSGRQLMSNFKNHTTIFIHKNAYISLIYQIEM